MYDCLDWMRWCDINHRLANKQAGGWAIWSTLRSFHWCSWYFCDCVHTVFLHTASYRLLCPSCKAHYRSRFPSCFSSRSAAPLSWRLCPEWFICSQGCCWVRGLRNILARILQRFGGWCIFRFLHERCVRVVGRTLWFNLRFSWSSRFHRSCRLSAIRKGWFGCVCFFPQCPKWSLSWIKSLRLPWARLRCSVNGLLVRKYWLSVYWPIPSNFCWLIDSRKFSGTSCVLFRIIGWLGGTVFPPLFREEVVFLLISTWTVRYLDVFDFVFVFFFDLFLHGVD